MVTLLCIPGTGPQDAHEVCAAGRSKAPGEAPVGKPLPLPPNTFQGEALVGPGGLWWPLPKAVHPMSQQADQIAGGIIPVLS